MINLFGNDPFVAFVGAGASALPPSNLPTWHEFNDLLLETLCEQLAEYSRNRQPTSEMLNLFRSRRDETSFFAPDFQAQLMEEEVGTDYFRVWQSLNSDVYGPVHAGLAELANKGKLAAIITTNFDQLLEVALQARDIEFDIFYDQKTFEDLATTIEERDSSKLLVVKIHGTIEDDTSLIDTLKQRVVGRPKTLEKSLQILLQNYQWLFLGFSGSDFSYDPHYLGILDAAADAKGFVFVAREGANIQKGVQNLAEAYGQKKAKIVYGDLSNWLSDTFSLDLPFIELGTDTDDAEVNKRIQDGIRQWVSGLGPMAVVNILYSMLKSLGMETQALWLLRKTWKSYRSPTDTESISYPRYNYNYGMTLLEAGFIRNPIQLDEDMSNLLEWREHADQNAYEYFARSYSSSKLLAAGGQLACLLAYRGEVGKAISLASAVTTEALDQKDNIGLCDIAIASVVIYDIVRLFDPAALQLQRCIEITKELGDEPRRAILCAHYGRFLTYSGNFGEAEKFLDEADRIGRRLNLQSVLLASKAARGRWLIDSEKSDEEAIHTLQQVVDAINSANDEPLFTKVDLLNPDSEPIVIKGKDPKLCRVLLDLNRAAYFAGNADIMNSTLDELDEVATDVFLGYCPHYYLAYATCLARYGDEGQRELIIELIGRARSLGEESGNPWIAQEADRLEKQIFD